MLAMDEPTSSLTPAEFERLAGSDCRAGRARRLGHLCLPQDGRGVPRLRDRDDTARRPQGSRCGHEGHVRKRGDRPYGRPRAGSAEHKGFAKTRSCSKSRALREAPPCATPASSFIAGEVLGISGLVGAGRTELLRLIAGVDRPDAGEIRARRQAAALGNPRIAIAAGLGLLPEERKREGIIARRSVRSNIALPSMGRFSRFGFVRRRAVAKESQALMADLNLQASQDRASDRSVFRRQPAEGDHRPLDRGRRAHPALRRADPRHRCRREGGDLRLIEKLAAEGRSMIVVSSELPEILRVADRVLVMREGRIAGVLERDSLSEEAIVALAVPQSSPQAHLRCKVLSHVRFEHSRRALRPRRSLRCRSAFATPALCSDWSRSSSSSRSSARIF